MAAALLALLAALLAAAAAALASEAAALAPETAAAAFVASVLFWAGWHAVTPMAETAAPAIMILRSVLEVMVLVPLGEIVSATVFADGVPVCTTPLAHQRLSSNGAAPPSFQAFGISELPDPARSNDRFGSKADVGAKPASGPSERLLRGESGRSISQDRAMWMGERRLRLGPQGSSGNTGVETLRRSRGPAGILGVRVGGYADISIAGRPAPTYALTGTGIAAAGAVRPSGVNSFSTRGKKSATMASASQPPSRE